VRRRRGRDLGDLLAGLGIQDPDDVRSLDRDEDVPSVGRQEDVVERRLAIAEVLVPADRE
jgi:hypothetical protein